MRKVMAGVAAVRRCSAGRHSIISANSSQEEPDYRALETDGDHQIRDYPALTVAETVVNGPRRAALDEGIRSSPIICRPSRATARQFR